ncbi:peptidase inhibitor family I36 protein, partial [Streptomyces sp. NPDC127108]|uniref:peptidase inhibitor family I36 protein n=1 Tax=Streptomyces sp. NPDC127108 TaxID=3345361 RepID=UPI003643854F
VTSTASAQGTRADETPGARAPGITQPGTAPASGTLEPVTFKGPDAAIKAWDYCQHGQACLFQHSNGVPDTNGGFSTYIVPACDRVYNLARGIDGKTSAVWNRAGSTLYVYDSKNARDLIATFPKYGPPINLAPQHNDRITSVYAPCGG